MLFLGERWPRGDTFGMDNRTTLAKKIKFSMAGIQKAIDSRLSSVINPYRN